MAAESVDDDGAGGFAGGGIEGDFSLLDVEGAVDDVESVGQGEADFAAGSVDGKLILGVEGCRGGGQEECGSQEFARGGGAGRVQG